MYLNDFSVKEVNAYYARRGGIRTASVKGYANVGSFSGLMQRAAAQAGRAAQAAAERVSQAAAGRGAGWRGSTGQQGGADLPGSTGQQGGTGLPSSAGQQGGTGLPSSAGRPGTGPFRQGGRDASPGLAG